VALHGPNTRCERQSIARAGSERDFGRWDDTLKQMAAGAATDVNRSTKRKKKIYTSVTNRPFRFALLSFGLFTHPRTVGTLRYLQYCACGGGDSLPTRTTI
jgi:hypothetical protein